MTAPLLRIVGLRAHVGSRTILDGVDIDVATPGVTVLLGPSGCGKSSLLRAICAPGRACGVAFSTQRALYRGATLGEANRPALLPQDTRSERTGTASIARLAELEHVLAGGEPLVCLDEPTAGLEPATAATMLGRLGEVAKTRALLVVTHDLSHARRLARDVVLLGGGRVVEHTPAAAFFDRPSTEEGCSFLRSGTHALPAPGALRCALAPEFREPPEHLRAIGDAPFAPGVEWIVPGTLAVVDTPEGESDAAVLARLGALGITAVLCASATPPWPAARLAQAGLAVVSCPLGETPPVCAEAARATCAGCHRRAALGGAFAVRRDADVSLTALFAAIQLVAMGASAQDAVRRTAPIGRLSVAQEQHVWEVEWFLDQAESEAAGRVSAAASPAEVV